MSSTKREEEETKESDEGLIGWLAGYGCYLERYCTVWCPCDAVRSKTVQLIFKVNTSLCQPRRVIFISLLLYSIALVLIEIIDSKLPAELPLWHYFIGPLAQKKTAKKFLIWCQVYPNLANRINLVKITAQQKLV
jgi:hypothetical protein